MSNQQQWDSALYDQRHNYVTKYGEDVVELLGSVEGQRVLDLGCGTGHLTAKLAERGAAAVVGLDNAATMIEQARAAYPDIEFVIGDGTNFRFDEPFDAVFSNAALHWMPDAEAVVRCVAAALKPGGRFVAEFGGKGNIQAVMGAVYEALDELTLPPLRFGPYYFASIGEYATLLEAHGFRVTFAAHFDRPTRVEGGDGLRSWLTMYATPIVSALDNEDLERLFAAVEDRLRAEHYEDGGWIIDYRRLRVRAIKE